MTLIEDHPHILICDIVRLESWTSCYERLTEVVACELSEVLDEATCEILSLLLPLASAQIGRAHV